MAKADDVMRFDELPDNTPFHLAYDSFGREVQKGVLYTKIPKFNVGNTIYDSWYEYTSEIGKGEGPVFTKLANSTLVRVVEKP